MCKKDVAFYGCAASTWMDEDWSDADREMTCFNWNIWDLVTDIQFMNTEFDKA